MGFGEEELVAKRIEQSPFKWTGSRKHNIERLSQPGITSQMRCTHTSGAGFICGSVKHIALEIWDAINQKCDSLTSSEAPGVNDTSNRSTAEAEHFQELACLFGCILAVAEESLQELSPVLCYRILHAEKESSFPFN